MDITQGESKVLMQNLQAYISKPTKKPRRGTRAHLRVFQSRSNKISGISCELTRHARRIASHEKEFGLVIFPLEPTIEAIPDFRSADRGQK